MALSLEEVVKLCEAELVVGDDLQIEIEAAYTSDLLSDVIGNAPENSILITVQNHINTLAVCTLVEIRAVMICHGREAGEEMRTVAAREGVALLRTRLNQFEASCRLRELAE